MFDPVHLGHLQLAEAVHALYGLDEVRLVPCGSPVHRAAAQAGPEQRIRMLELAIGERNWLRVDPRECRSARLSYTFDTVNALQRELPDTLLCLVVGLDAFLQFHTWHRWQALLDLVQLTVASRPGYALEPRALDESLRAEVDRRLQPATEAPYIARVGTISVAQLSTPAVSSTTIRSRIRHGEDVAALLPAAVADYIRTNRLYTNEE